MTTMKLTTTSTQHRLFWYTAEQKRALRLEDSIKIANEFFPPERQFKNDAFHQQTLHNNTNIVQHKLNSQQQQQQQQNHEENRVERIKCNVCILRDVILHVVAKTLTLDTLCNLIFPLISGNSIAVKIFSYWLKDEGYCINFTDKIPMCEVQQRAFDAGYLDIGFGAFDRKIHVTDQYVLSRAMLHACVQIRIEEALSISQTSNFKKNCKTRNCVTAVCYASGNSALVNLLTQTKYITSKFVAHNHYLPVMIASKRGHVSLVREAFKKYARAMLENRAHMRHMLRNICFAGSLSLVKFFCGLNLHMDNNMFWTMLCIAMTNQHADMVSYLHSMTPKIKPKLELPDIERAMLLPTLCIACATGHASIARDLISVTFWKVGNDTVNNNNNNNNVSMLDEHIDNQYSPLSLITEALCFALRTGQTEIVNTVIPEFVTLELPLDRVVWELCCACACGNVNAAEAIRARYAPKYDRLMTAVYARLCDLHQTQGHINTFDSVCNAIRLTVGGPRCQQLHPTVMCWVAKHAEIEEVHHATPDFPTFKYNVIVDESQNEPPRKRKKMNTTHAQQHLGIQRIAVYDLHRAMRN